MHTVVETPAYLAAAADCGMSEAEREAVVEVLAHEPSAGAVMPGTGGCRKVRFAGRGRGKSGGYRVITFYSGPAAPVFLLTVFAKGDRPNLTKRERNALETIAKRLAATYGAKDET